MGQRRGRAGSNDGRGWQGGVEREALVDGLEAVVGEHGGELMVLDIGRE